MTMHRSLIFTACLELFFIMAPVFGLIAPLYLQPDILSFDGSTKIQLPTCVGMKDALSLSVSVFVKTTKFSFCVVSLGEHRTNQNLNVCASRGGGQRGGFGGGLSVWVHNMGYHVLDTSGLESARALTNGEWHQYAITYSGGKDIAFYVDGLLVGKTSIQTPIQFGSDAVFYGGSTTASGAWNIHWLTGEAKYLSISKGIAMSAEDVRSIFTVGLVSIMPGASAVCEPPSPTSILNNFTGTVTGTPNNFAREDRYADESRISGANAVGVTVAVAIVLVTFIVMDF